MTFDKIKGTYTITLASDSKSQIRLFASLEIDRSQDWGWSMWFVVKGPNFNWRYQNLSTACREYDEAVEGHGLA